MEGSEVTHVFYTTVAHGRTFGNFIDTMISNTQLTLGYLISIEILIVKRGGSLGYQKLLLSFRVALRAYSTSSKVHERMFTT